MMFLILVAQCTSQAEKQILLVDNKEVPVAASKLVTKLVTMNRS
jgi:hypothetical protein